MTAPVIPLNVAEERVHANFLIALEKWQAFLARHKNDLQLQSRVRLAKQITPIVKWKKIGFRTAGKCIISSNTIVIVMNTNFLYSEDAAVFVEKTIIHEVAHALAYIYYSTTGHDKIWRGIAKFLGDDGERCHTYKLPANAVRKHARTAFVCDKCGIVHNLTQLMIKRCSTGAYRCRCGNNAINFVK